MQMKKIIKKCCLVLLAGLFVPWMPIASEAQETVQSELIQNGGFETAEENVPIKWGFVNGTYGTHFKLDTTNPKTGTSCMGLYANTAGYVYIEQIITGLIGGKEYTVSFSARTGTENTARLLVKLEYRKIGPDGKSVPNGDKEVYNSRLKSTGEWEKIEVTFTPPEETYTASVTFRLMSKTEGYKMFLDDISVTGEKRENYLPDIDPSTLPVYEEKPMAEGAVELMTDGDIENQAAWSPQSDPGWSDYILYSSEYCHGDTGHSIGLKNDGSKDKYVAKHVTGLTPCAEHQISVYLKTHALGSTGFGFKFDYYNRTYDTNTGKWSQVWKG